MKSETIPFEPVIGYPFNDRATPENLRKFETQEQVDEFLRVKYCGGCCFGTDSLLSEGQYREMAFTYDFTPHLKKYLVRMPDGHYMHQYAPNVAALRRAAYLPRNATVFPFPEES